jgi:hypothetical protein
MWGRKMYDCPINTAFKTNMYFSWYWDSWDLFNNKHWAVKDFTRRTLVLKAEFLEWSWRFNIYILVHTRKKSKEKATYENTKIHICLKSSVYWAIIHFSTPQNSAFRTKVLLVKSLTAQCLLLNKSHESQYQYVVFNYLLIHFTCLFPKKICLS